MNLRISTLSPIVALALAACALPDSPTLELGPDAATTTDALALTLSAPADADADVDYSVAWTRDGDAMSSFDDALVIPADATAKGEVWTATVTPIDKRDRAGTPVSVEITILNTPPTAELSMAEEVVLTTADLTAEATSSDVDGDVVSLEWSWLKDGEKTGITTETVPASETTKGEIWTAVVVPSDDEASGLAVEVSVSIDNSIPVADDVSLSPEAPMVTEAVVASAMGTDQDGDTLTWTYVWTVDGEVVDGVNGAELPAGSFTKGQTVAVEAIPNDGFVDGPSASTSVVAINSLPSIESASIEPSAVQEGDVASCVAAGWSDADGDTPSYRVTWEVNGSQVAETPTIDGSLFDRGNSVVCTLTPDDGEALGTAVTSASVIVQNTAPAMTSVALDRLSPGTMDDVTATAAGVTDADGDEVSLAFAWSVNGSVVWSDSASASSTLSSEYYSKGDTIAVSVTPEDDADMGASVASSVATVVNTVPTVASLAFDLSSPKTDDVVTVTASDVVDVDGDSVSLNWVWLVNGSTVKSETTTGTSATLDGASFFDSGDTVSVFVTPTDGTGLGTSVASTSLTVVNSLPTLDSVALSPSAPKADEDVTATVSGADDLDGDSLTFTYIWSVNGTEVSTDSSTSESASLDASNYGKGDSITVSVSAADADGSSSAVTSSAVNVVNSLPVATAVTLDLAAPDTDDAVTATVTATDLDGDTLSYDWSWTVDGTEVFTETTSGTTSTLQGGDYFSKDQVLVATVTPKDDDGAGTSATSASVTVVNSPPSLASATLSPDPLKEGLTAGVLFAASDADGDALTYTYAWTVNGTAAGTSATLTSASFDKGDTVQVTVTADDGDTTTTLASNTLTVANTAPTAPAIAIDPTAPDDTDELLCDITTASTDADGDTITYDITWEKNGVAWTGSTTNTTHSGDTIDAADVVGGDDWSCTVSAFDGSDASADVTSTEVTVERPVYTFGVISGNGWVICREDSSTAWVAHAPAGGGTYNAESICSHLGYTGGVDAQGGTCGTSCGRCGTAGLESYDGGGGSTTSMANTVHWRCTN